MDAEGMKGKVEELIALPMCCAPIKEAGKA